MWRLTGRPRARTAKGPGDIPHDSLNPTAADASKPSIAVCRSGNRSGKATERLRAGRLRVRNMTGGMNARAHTGPPVHATDGTPGNVR
jgi:rhodanese-related sulfurtransferase